MFVVKREEHNPILVPDKDHYWEEYATFNMCPIKRGNKIYGLYRAISAMDALQEPHQLSVIGLAESKDGTDFKNRNKFIFPTEDWEKFGCEDPRITYFEGKYYIFYTALSKYPFESSGIKVGVACSKDLKTIKEKHLVTPFNAKAMTLFPKRINGKIVVIFSYHTDQPPVKTAFAYLDKIEDLWSPSFWEEWEKDIDENIVDLKRSVYDHVEVGAPPVKTKHGWLLIYSYIKNYFPSPQKTEKIFGIEAVLLDLKNPQKIIGRTNEPLLVPEESFELSGSVANIVFPTGALISKNILTVYYGAADTVVGSFKVNLNDLVLSINYKTKDNYCFKRSPKNPILLPDKQNIFEAKAVFNPAAILINGRTHLIYRALSLDNTSSFGYAMSKNGVDIIKKENKPVYVPREDFENKKAANVNSGCEDPRLTKIGKNIYVCYTAYDGINPPRVAISSINEKDFVANNWNWEKPFLITPQGFDDKDACLFPEKFPLGYFIIHRVGNEICGDYLSTLDFEHEVVKKCIRIIGPRQNAWDNNKVGVSGPPIKTKYGWLLLYHGVSKEGVYRIGSILLDLKDPALVLARSTDSIFEPEESYEKNGIVNNVVFPCGMIVKNKKLYIYYGGGDQVIGVATMDLNLILMSLVHSLKY